jgi:hypothetical protein
MNDTTSEMLLDETLDDLADLPQVAPYPAGAHLAKMFISVKEGKENNGVKAPPSYLATFEYVNVLELTDPSKTPPAAGDKAFVNIYTKKKDGTPNEFGQGQLKLLLKPLQERLGTSNVRELIEATKVGVEVGITTGIKKGQEGYSDQMTVVKCMLS